MENPLRLALSNTEVPRQPAGWAFIAAALLLCLPVYLNAQVIAGDANGLLYSSSDILQQQLGNPSGNYMTFTDSLDLNGDGLPDIEFSSVLSNVPDFSGAVTGLNALHDHLELSFLADSNYVKRFLAGQTIDNSGNWLADKSSAMASDFIGFGGPVSEGEWLPDLHGYIGFRITQGLLVRYGWIEIQVAVSQSFMTLDVIGYAIEPIVNSVAEYIPETFSVFPNPVRETLYTDLFCPTDLFLYNAAGSLIKTVNRSNTLNVSDLPPGLYILRAQADNGQWYATRFLKE